MEGNGSSPGELRQVGVLVAVSGYPYLPASLLDESFGNPFFRISWKALVGKDVLPIYRETG